jgi:hypothetical protein
VDRVLRRVTAFCLDDRGGVNHSMECEFSKLSELHAIADEHLATCETVEFWEGKVRLLRLTRKTVN